MNYTADLAKRLIAADDGLAQSVLKPVDDVEGSQVGAGQEDGVGLFRLADLESCLADRVRVDPGDAGLDLFAEGQGCGNMQARRIEAGSGVMSRTMPAVAAIISDSASAASNTGSLSSCMSLP